MFIIGLAGPMCGGKTTTANLLKKHLKLKRGIDSTIIPMAKPLKDLAYSLGWDGQKDRKGRKLLQTLGVVCRECLDQDYWVKKYALACASCGHEVIICDDIRFENEAELCDIVIRITGRDPWQWRLTEHMRWLRKWLCHSSEQCVSTYDCTINNSKGIVELETAVSEAIFHEGA